MQIRFKFDLKSGPVTYFVYGMFHILVPPRGYFLPSVIAYSYDIVFLIREANTNKENNTLRTSVPFPKQVTADVFSPVGRRGHRGDAGDASPHQT